MLHTLNASSWNTLFSLEVQKTAIFALESGHIVYLPQLPFILTSAEKELLTPRILAEDSKNISFNAKTKQLKGIDPLEQDTLCLKKLIKRFSAYSTQFLQHLFPTYAPYLINSRTNFRPLEVMDRKKTVLHLDTFPSVPTQGKRILRIFSNVNPVRARVWEVGQSFQDVVNYFSAQLHPPVLGMRKLLFWLNLTQTYRSLYDHYMLQLDHLMKKDTDYQVEVNKTTLIFQPATTWIALTDCVSHAPSAGQFVLEQVMYLLPEGMAYPELSPCHILQQSIGKNLL
jgi:hypothetical protein